MSPRDDTNARTPIDPENPWAQRRALLALIPLALFFAAILVWMPWYSNFDVDSLTHFEQVRSVAHYGSIGFPNGPVRDFPELRTRWFIHAHGLAWGIVPSVMAYLLAPAMRIGGFAGTLRVIWLLYALAALMVYAFTVRLTRRPGLAVAAAYTLVFGTSLPFWATMIAPFVPVTALGITAAYLASRTFDSPSPRREWLFAIGAGLCSSAALGSHLLWSFAWAGLGAVLFLADGKLASRLRRASGYGIASIPFLSLQSWVNHERFGTWNPISYGPCSATSCTEATNDQTAHAFLAAVEPALPYLLAFACVLWLVRHSKRALALATMVGACAALVPDTVTKRTTVLLVRALWGYVVDLGNLDIGYSRLADGPGSFNTGYCVRSLLQCTPVLAGALLAGRQTRDLPTRHRAAVQLLAAVVVGVLTGCILRANTGGRYVYGFPFLNIRYVTLLVPAAMVLSATAIAKAPWRDWHAALAATTAIVGASYLASRTTGDQDLLRRQLTHWLTLAFALAVFVAAARFAASRSAVNGHVLALFAALAAGAGGAITLGIDRVVIRDFRGFQDRRTRELARCVPERRFILLGGYAMDEALALHDRRDILFINVGMGPRGGARARTLVDSMLAPDRPAYLIEDTETGPWRFYWPGFVFRTLPDCPRIRRIERGDPGPRDEFDDDEDIRDDEPQRRVLPFRVPTLR